MPVLEIATSKLIDDLRSARRESDRLFSILKPETLYERPIAERHRVIFYIGHLDAFDSIQICGETLGIKSLDPQLDDLFQAGIDPDSVHLPADTPEDWPNLQQVEAYVERCRRSVDENLERAPEDAICIALEHREMHLETLAYMFHNFPYEKKTAPYASEYRNTSSFEPQNDWREIPEGEAVLGKPRDGSFGWDNEYDEFKVRVPAFRMQRFNVTNGEYLRFVRDHGAAMPHFWSERGGTIYFRGMFDEIPLPLDWPVYVTQREAEAYADRLGTRLPSEEEFHRAAYGSPSHDVHRYPWGNEAPMHKFGNFDFKRWDPEPVHATPAGDSAFGVSQLVGNGWEWTRTPFAAFPGFKAHETYPGYSANFFDGEHYVLKGGSPRTVARLLRASFRNWFRRDYPHVYATFRCVES
ncbi:MAG: SUMF1/EgtB/PvdO family nonheme iron enzyme [Acidobacteriaceae bacterium]|nr:SUMF1/EgtB/PvdO family nonheme iron enzyme [Acidobacteriaceae bacterium]MBV9780224.1 SUMF1/EgtB/PvdO family nonheme iron enzyme [Acidobacteriaceae bacterium]